MTEEQYLAVSNLTRLRTVAEVVRNMCFTDYAENEQRQRWYAEMWDMILKYEKTVDGFN